MGRFFPAPSLQLGTGALQGPGSPSLSNPPLLGTQRSHTPPLWFHQSLRKGQLKNHLLSQIGDKTLSFLSYINMQSIRNELHLEMNTEKFTYHGPASQLPALAPRWFLLSTQLVQVNLSLRIIHGNQIVWQATFIFLGKKLSKKGSLMWHKIFPITVKSDTTWLKEENTLKCSPCKKSVTVLNIVE